MNNTKRELSHKVIITGLAVIFSLIMALSMISAPTVQTSSQVVSPEISSQGFIPNPIMNSNITWSTFYNSWTSLEYNNGTANQTLNTELNQAYQNPISVNALDIHSTQLYNTSTGYNNTNKWTANYAYTYGSALTQHIATSTTINGHPAFLLQTNGTGTGSTKWTPYFSIPFSAYPSNNIAYDYLTVIANVSSAFSASGQGLVFTIENQTGTDASSSVHIIILNNTIKTSGSTTSITPGNTIEFSTPLSNLKGLNWNSTKSNGLTLQVNIYTPQIQTTTFETVTIDSIQMTENPLYTGTTQLNGTQQPLENYIGNAQLTSFNPDFQWKDVTNNGYTVSTSQTLQNPTSQQTSINTNNYIEQGTYQGFFELPNAPDLSYSSTNITLQMTLPGTQFEVANLNGISYLSSIQAKTNGTFSFETVSPTKQNTIILEVEFTASQWNASSTAPSFWSIQGLEYYWWIGVIGLLSLIGLGSVASAHWGGTEENLKVPKGKFGR